MSTSQKIAYDYFSCNAEEVARELGQDALHSALSQMCLIRNFERRAEAAYLQGKIGGFFHSYMGQEAIQVGALMAMGHENWWVTSYRCHALALLLGATPDELMAELFGRVTGNAKGRGGSMHFFTKRLLGGFGIVAGQVPIAVGAAFTIHYLDRKNEVAVCFLGDGAVAQGAFHEAANLASLWNLPCIFVIENNLWGMGTAVSRALAVERIAEEKAPGYQMKSYTFDGTDFFSCYAGFKHVYNEVLTTRRPVMIEAVAERFRGHSISDPGLYRTKDSLKAAMQGDPIERLKQALLAYQMIDEAVAHDLDNQQKEVVLKALDFAEKSPWPDPITLEDDVFAP